MSKKVTTTIYITEEQQHLLRVLNQRSKVPVAEYIRQGIDLVLNHYRELLPGQMEFDSLPFGLQKSAQKEESSLKDSSHTQQS